MNFLVKITLLLFILFQTSGCTVMLVTYYLNSLEEESAVPTQVVEAPQAPVEAQPVNIAIQL